MRRLIRVLGIAAFLALPVRAAIGLDATAHPANAGNLTASHDFTSTWITISTPTFSTGAGPTLLVAMTATDGAASATTAITGAGLTWTKRVDFTSTWGAQIWTAFSASSALTSVAVTLNMAATVSQAALLGVIVLNGVPSTEAACIGNTGGQFTVTAATPNATVTPAATGSWLLGMFAQDFDTTTLAAATNTSAFDGTVAIAGGDYFAFGRFKSGGTVTTTTSGAPVTFGSSTAIGGGDVYSVALEIKVAAGSAVTPRGTLLGVWP